MALTAPNAASSESVKHIEAIQGFLRLYDAPFDHLKTKDDERAQASQGTEPATTPVAAAG